MQNFGGQFQLTVHGQATRTCRYFLWLSLLVFRRCFMAQLSQYLCRWRKAASACGWQRRLPCKEFVCQKVDDTPQLIGPVLPVMSPSACQSACQTCTPELLLTFGWSSLDLISLLFAVINPYITSTYKSHIRTENPCVGGSNPLLPIS